MYLRYRTACHARYGDMTRKKVTIRTLYTKYIDESVGRGLTPAQAVH